MITKFEFDTIVISSVSSDSYNIVDDSGFAPAYKANFESIPRSDNRNLISAFATPAVRTIQLLMRGSERNDFIDKVSELYSYVNTSQTFKLYVEKFTAGVGTSRISLQFDGYISSISRINEQPYEIDFGYFEIRIESNSRLLQSQTLETETVNITPAGFVFPFVFPFVFSGATNSITINNTGSAPLYPIFTLDGSGNVYDILTDSDHVSNQLFSYNNAIADGDYVVITPSADDNSKVLDQDGTSRLSSTNFNFEALVVPAGETVTFTMNVGSDLNANTALTIDYRLQYLGI
jgi:hypothetical protein